MTTTMKLKNLYAEHANLIKHKTANKDEDLENQTQFSEKLDMLFDDEEYCTQVKELGMAKRCKTVLTPNIAATLELTIKIVRKATMIMASVINEAGRSFNLSQCQKVV